MTNDPIKTAIYEVTIAYGDINKRASSHSERNLHFLCSIELSIKDAIRVLKKCGVTSYNTFKPDLLKRLPKGSIIRIGRDYSPVFFFETRDLFFTDVLANMKKDCKADELHLWQTTDRGFIFRLWYD